MCGLVCMFRSSTTYKFQYVACQIKHDTGNDADIRILSLNVSRGKGVETLGSRSPPKESHGGPRDPLTVGNAKYRPPPASRNVKRLPRLWLNKPPTTVAEQQQHKDITPTASSNIKRAPATTVSVRARRRHLRASSWFPSGIFSESRSLGISVSYQSFSN